jgi:EAL and modified HD-GYP domain-containing signal transduction protein
MSEFKNYLARQPIINLRGEIVGYELLFRSTDSQFADIDDYANASASVIFNALSDFGFEKVLGPHKGFFNVNSEILMSDNLELLPARHVVLELLEFIEINSAIIERCRELKSKGFMLALDDNIFSEIYNPLYEIVDIVKVDVLSMSDTAVSQMVDMLKPWPVKLLAEKVESERQYRFCLERGFQLFQGYFFARPTLLKQNRLDSDKGALMRLLNQVLSDAEVSEIEQTFKHNPDLTYRLLRLVNSVMIAHREKINSLRQAIMTVGFQHLKRWVLMALFTNSTDGGQPSPLLEMATVRGRLMETIVMSYPELITGPDSPELAFLSGLLSLMDAQLGVTMEELVEQLNLRDEIRRALLDREGTIGILISLCECMENDNVGSVSELLAQVGITEDDFLAMQLEVINWTNILCAAA